MEILCFLLCCGLVVLLFWQQAQIDKDARAHRERVDFYSNLANIRQKKLDDFDRELTWLRQGFEDANKERYMALTDMLKGLPHPNQMKQPPYWRVQEYRGAHHLAVPFTDIYEAEAVADIVQHTLHCDYIPRGVGPWCWKINGWLLVKDNTE